MRWRADDGVRSVGISQLSGRLSAQQGVHLESYRSRRISSRSKVSIIWGDLKNKNLADSYLPFFLYLMGERN